MANGIWLDTADLLDSQAEARLRECLSKDLTDIYWGVGYPSPARGTITFPSLSGFVPDSEIGILVTQAQVQQVRTLCASIDARLKLWAWFGTWSVDNAGGDDAIGHQNARIDIDTGPRRTAVIDACMTVARWGFYGIQDDTEDLRPASLESSGQFGATYVTFTNAFAAAAKAEGFRYAPFVPSVWTTFNNSFLSGITGPDAIILAGHTGDAALWNSLTTSFFANAQRPVIFNFGWPGAAPLMASRLDALPFDSVSSKIAGYSWYLFKDWTNNWNLWDSWRASHSPPTPTDPPPPTPTTKRWAPGHYMHCTEAEGRTGISQVKREFVRSNPNFIGYQVTIYWGQTEVTLGNYSALYTQLDAILAAAQADGKKIWLRMFERSFVGYARPRPMPQYVTDNGWDYTTSGSENIWAVRLWESGAKAAFLDWCEEVAKYCALHPEFVLLSTEEYRVQGDYNQPGFTWSALHQLWRDVADRLLTHAGDCVVHLSTGWAESYPPRYAADKPILDQLALAPRKVALGPTDLRKDDNNGNAFLSTNFGAFMTNPVDHPIAPGYRGLSVFCANYEWINYQSVESPAEHLRWGVDELGLHYIGWDPDVGPEQNMRWNWNDALAAVNAAGGRINLARPAHVAGSAPVVVPPDRTLPFFMDFDEIVDPVTGALNWTAIGAAINEAPAWASAAIQTANVGAPFSFTPTLAVVGFPAPSFSKVSGPSWASVDSADGEITGTPTGSPTTATVVVRADNGVAPAVDLAVEIVVSATIVAPVISTTTIPSAEEGATYYVPLSAGGTAPFTWTLEGTGAPDGLGISATSGVLFGPITESGSFTFTVRCTGPTGLYDEQTYSIEVGSTGNAPAFTTSTLDDATLGDAYSETIGATGATPRSFEVVAGALPPGLELDDETGEVFGATTLAGGFPFTVKLSNAYGEVFRQFSIRVLPAEASTTVSPWTAVLRRR